MSMVTERDYVAFRRDLHRHPEPAWCEFYTTARIVEELRDRNVDEIHVGPDALNADARRNVPDDDELATWMERARETDVESDVLDRLEGGYTGCVAEVQNGDGPVVGLRVDIDALPIEEATDDDHAPAAEGFRSEVEGFMHACGHDAHATIGLGVLDEVLDGEFAGTLKVFFQPGEEQIVGGKPMAESGLLDDVDYLFAVHVGLDHPTGKIVAGIDDFLAVSHFLAEFEGSPAHAGGHPEKGNNTVQAAATAIQNLYGIPRHADGSTRVNAGIVGGGTATNIIPEETFIEGEVRGETTELRDYMDEQTTTVLETAAEMHDCEIERTLLGGAPSAESDAELVDVVADAASDVADVDEVARRDQLGGSEDATYLMKYVQDRGGYATYVGVGTDHPGGHHTSEFDVDEATLDIGIETLSDAITRVGEVRPEVPK